MATALAEDEQAWLTRWRIGRKPAAEWLAGMPPENQVRAVLIKVLDRDGPGSLAARVLAGHLSADPHRLYAENWPRKAARLAAACRERGDEPHAEALHGHLVALMFCGNCGRPLDDPASINRGIGPDCWQRIDPVWRQAIAERMALTEIGQA